MSPALARSLEENRDELTAEEAAAFAEEQAQKYLGMSIDEFHRRANEDSLPHDPMVIHVALLAGVDIHSC